jgi:hypothetical protein
MKKLILLFCGILIFSMSFGQVKIEKPTTLAEQFGVTTGTLIEKQIMEIGKVKGITVQIMYIKDLIDVKELKALRFEYRDRSINMAPTYSAVLDLDEVDGLIKSMKNLTTNVFPSSRDYYTEVTYRSKTGFQAGAYFNIDRKKWIAFIKLDQYDSNSFASFNSDDLTSLLSIVEQAKANM